MLKFIIICDLTGIIISSVNFFFIDIGVIVSIFHVVGSGEANRTESVGHNISSREFVVCLVSYHTPLRIESEISSTCRISSSGEISIVFFKHTEFSGVSSAVQSRRFNNIQNVFVGISNIVIVTLDTNFDISINRRFSTSFE